MEVVRLTCFCRIIRILPKPDDLMGDGYGFKRFVKQHDAPFCLGHFVMHAGGAIHQQCKDGIDFCRVFLLFVKKTRIPFRKVAKRLVVQAAGVQIGSQRRFFVLQRF